MSTPPRDQPPSGSGARQGQSSSQAPTTPPPRPTTQPDQHEPPGRPFPPFVPPPDQPFFGFDLPLGLARPGIHGIAFGPPPPGQPLGFVPGLRIAPDGPMGFMPGPPPGSTSNAPFTFFMSFFTGSPSDHPDPAAAEELVRSLPTVSKGLFDRINSVIVAEQKLSGDDEEPGWKCGVCLDGLGEEVEETGIKGLPCNHLFHSACVQPWFETNHTCPTCRLDLDPMNTLRDSTRQGGGPAPTSGPNRARPYGPRPNPPPAGQGQDNGPQFTFVWHMPGPPPPEEREPTANGDAPRTPTQPARTPGPDPSLLSPPTQTFQIPLRASPAPMGRSASDPGSQSPINSTTAPPAGATQGSPSQPSAEGSGSRPVPQRRTHINVEAVLGSAPSDASNAPPGDPNPAHEPVTAPFLPPFPNPTLTPRPPVTHTHQHVPHFHTIINIGGPPSAPHEHAPPHPNPPPTAPSATTAPSKAIVRESLDHWVETRERALGWRCDAPVCFSAPTSDHPDHEALPENTISIFSGSQVDIPRHGDAFELHACEHRWHRSCLESTAKTSRRWSEGSGEDEGKVWVRCDRCRKDGWIPRHDEMDTVDQMLV